MASRRKELIGQFVRGGGAAKFNWGDGKVHTRPKGAQYRSNAPAASTAPAKAPATPAPTPAQQQTLSTMENAYKALPSVQRARVSGARQSTKYKWAGEKVARHMRPQGAQYRSNAKGGPADYLHYQGKGAKYNWGEGKGTVHTRPKKNRLPSMP